MDNTSGFPRKDMPVTATNLQLATRAWVAALPDHLRPNLLHVMFPRIANRIAQCWDNPKAACEYFDELLFDERGNRQGFPIAISLELAVLKENVVARMNYQPIVGTRGVSKK